MSGTEEVYDIVIVGSGAAGGTVAYVAAKAGARVLMLEAGRDYDPAAETPMFQRDHEAPLRAIGTTDKPFNYYDAAIGGWELEGEPYSKEEGHQFRWFRTRMLGGRTNHWGRHVPRFAPLDFKGKTRDGLGVDWPLDYQMIEPYYNRVEAIMGVSGAMNGLEHHPDGRPDIIQPAPKGRIPDLFIKAGAAALGIPCVPNRRAILTRPLDDRQPCFWATPCIRGCSIGAAFQSTTSLIPLAKATGKLTVKINAMAARVVVDRAGRATGVEWFDSKTKALHFAKGRSVVLAASSAETTRILFNSQNASQPDGLANSSGQLGKNLADTAGASLVAQFPGLAGRPSYNEEGYAVGHYYMPWWEYAQQEAGRLSFTRGYHIEFNGDRNRAPNMGVARCADGVQGLGSALRKAVSDNYGSFVTFDMRGETIPSSKSFCKLDSDKQDQYGLPVLKFAYEWGDQEIEMTKHFIKTISALTDRLGGKIVTKEKDPAKLMNTPGEIIHEVGTARMGFNDRDSVTNSYGNTWQISNLYVADGAVFASSPHKNPTLTIMAIAWRGTEDLLRRLGANDFSLTK